MMNLPLYIFFQAGWVGDFRAILLKGIAMDLSPSIQFMTQL